tara:strand:- start:55 stop:468 length:414 start_codon:yes stop_codon:yes gene_type:complete
MYNNGQRKGMMYGGGATPRKPMMYGGMTKKKKMNMGGLAAENRKSSTDQTGMMNPMGSMTEKKKFSMGMRKGGKTEKTKVAVSSAGMNEYGLAAKKVGDKYESYKGGKKTGTFNSLKALEKHQLKLIEIDDNLASRT